MGEGPDHLLSMVLRQPQTCFTNRHTHPNSKYSNFCHVLKIQTENTMPLELCTQLIEFVTLRSFPFLVTILFSATTILSAVFQPIK